MNNFANFILIYLQLNQIVFYYTVDDPKANRIASFGNQSLEFNKSRMDKKYFTLRTNSDQLDLIIHELGHHHGHHTEMSYHHLLTKLGAELTMLALHDPSFFN